jgi:Ca2+-binding RTX toxin-like protein
MRRTIVLLATMALTLLVASGVALAVTRIGTDGPDTLRGSRGDDNLIGRGGNDVLLSLAGNDTLLGGPGKDVVNGGNLAEPFAGNKNLEGGEGNDAVQGGLGYDNVLGGEGNDFMQDGEFEPPAVKDILSAGDGNDVLNVGNKPAGKDVVTCGGGFDRVLADRTDVVTPDCEKVFIGPAAADKFFNSIPESFFEGLNPEVFQDRS